MYLFNSPLAAVVMLKFARNTIVVIALSLSVGVMGNLAYGQNQSLDALQQRREAAQAEIERLDKELAKLETTGKDLNEQLALTLRRQAQRKEVLRSIEQQIGVLDVRSKKQSSEATLHSQRLVDIRELFVANLKALYLLQMSVSPNNGLLLSEEVRREKIYREHLTKIVLTDLKQQSLQIDSLKGQLGIEIKDIATRKSELVTLRRDEANQVAQIESERKKIEALQRSLGGQSKELAAQKEKQRTALDELQRQIQAIIEAEMRNTNNADEKVLQVSSKNFAAQKGNLPSPLNNAKIVDAYGLHAHPTQKGIKVDNKGVNLRGVAGATIRVVAGGEVRKVFTVGGMGTSVLVRHGEYLTVYSSLDSVRVKSGDVLYGGQIIGSVGVDGLLHFEIWKETTTQNPSHWIKF